MRCTQYFFSTALSLGHLCLFLVIKHVVRMIHPFVVKGALRSFDVAWWSKNAWRRKMYEGAVTQKSNSVDEISFLRLSAHVSGACGTYLRWRRSALREGTDMPLPAGSYVVVPPQQREPSRGAHQPQQGVKKHREPRMPPYNTTLGRALRLYVLHVFVAACGGSCC